MTDRATGSRPGAFQAVCERPAHGPVRFKRRAVAERAFLTLLGTAAWPGQFPKAHRPSAAQYATSVPHNPSQYPTRHVSRAPSESVPACNR